MLRPYSCQLLVGEKHLEDKLSVIAKNSSPNASPVQLSVVSWLAMDNRKKSYQLPITNYPLPN
jgi:ATP-dependent DNA helicase RecQ